MGKGNNMYVVDRILDRRHTQVAGRFEYLVKWKGWDLKDSTWEGQKNLKNVMNLIEEYQNNREIEKQSAQESEDKDVSPQKSPAKKKRIKKMKKKLFQEQKEEIEQNCEGVNQRDNSDFAHNSQTEINGKRAKETIDSIGESGKSITIHGLKKQRDTLWYFLSENGKKVWVERDYLIQNYPVDLCQFYEKNLVFE